MDFEEVLVKAELIYQTRHRTCKAINTLSKAGELTRHLPQV